MTNRLLATLSPEVLERLQPLERVHLPIGLSLYESGTRQDHVYFPTTGIVSLHFIMENGDSGEIAIVGNDGIVGTALFMGGDSTPSRAVVQSAGEGYRLKAAALKAEFARGGEFMYLLLRYMQSLITQMSQTSVCNRHHAIDQQFCRLLLLSLDRLPSNVIKMTQELMAYSLGVRRESVTEAAGRLQDDGLIHYSRGKITVVDRPELEARVCECYSVVRLETERLFQSLSKP